MAKEGNADFLRELLRFDAYKPNQGQVARKATVGVLVATLLLGIWRLFEVLKSEVTGGGIVYGVPIVLLLVGLWVCFRVYNYERFAEFLIAVEGEMYKVSWPTWETLMRSSMVVIFLIFAMAVGLYAFDIFWQVFFRFIGVLP